jgi:hypothetical protein
MLNLFVRTTKTMRGWPLLYTTYHQELEDPYRYAAWCIVIRLWRRGLVIGRWTDAWHDDELASAVAIGARRMDAWWDEIQDYRYDPDDDGDTGEWGCLVA